MWDIKNKFGRYEDRLMEYQQSIRYMSVPTKRLESDVLKHTISFGDNPIIRWMFRNVVIYRDPNSNIKLDKSRSRNKIDGVVALVDAYGGWLNDENAPTVRKIYTTHSLRTV
jgi:phage terminase large subunit-like protein